MLECIFEAIKIHDIKQVITRNKGIRLFCVCTKLGLILKQTESFVDNFVDINLFCLQAVTLHRKTGWIFACLVTF